MFNTFKVLLILFFGGDCKAAMSPVCREKDSSLPVKSATVCFNQKCKNQPELFPLFVLHLLTVSIFYKKSKAAFKCWNFFAFFSECRKNTKKGKNVIQVALKCTTKKNILENCFNRNSKTGNLKPSYQNSIKYNTKLMSRPL